MSEKSEHTSCAGSHDPKAIEAVLDMAEAHCSAQGLRLTEGRRKVLGILLREHRALGAYEILDILRAEEDGGASPPIVYRALDFLTQNGFVHKIERLSAFVACMHPDERHSPAFMICRECHAVDEAHVSPATGALGDAARAKGFQIERTIVEAEGLCPDCADAAPV